MNCCGCECRCGGEGISPNSAAGVQIEAMLNGFAGDRKEAELMMEEYKALLGDGPVTDAHTVFESLMELFDCSQSKAKSAAMQRDMKKAAALGKMSKSLLNQASRVIDKIQQDTTRDTKKFRNIFKRG